MRQSVVDLITQVWVRLTGREVHLDEHPWLDGPIGDTDVIGEGYFHRWAAREGLHLDATSPIRGLLPHITQLNGPSFDSSKLQPNVADFYCQTSRYAFHVAPEWKGGLRLFAWLVTILFSKRLRQLNLPLSNKAAEAGAASDVYPLERGGQHVFSAWIRTLEATGNTLYAGAYSTSKIPGHRGPCVKVVFPLPNGSAIVLLKPEVLSDGSLLLRSEGKRFGDPGFYFYVRKDARSGVAKYVRSLRETIHVHNGETPNLHATHEVTFWGRHFLTQRYSMTPRYLN